MIARLIENYFNNEQPAESVKKHLSNYYIAHTFVVCRSKIWLVSAKQIFLKEYILYRFWELQFEFLLSFSNKSLIISELMWMRSLKILT